MNSAFLHVYKTCVQFKDETMNTKSVFMNSYKVNPHSDRQTKIQTAPVIIYNRQVTAHGLNRICEYLQSTSEYRGKEIHKSLALKNAF